VVNELINEATRQFGTKLRETEEEVVKELLRHVGINPDTINKDNYDDAKKEMYRKGYRIEQIPEANTNVFNLYTGHRFVIGIKVTHKIEYKDEKVTMNINREFTKSP
jgi:hypothetical protein